MPARRSEIGEHGKITLDRVAGGIRASTYFRDSRGVRRRIVATATTGTAAQRALLAELDQVLATGGLGYTAQTTLGDVAEEWFERFVELVADGRRSPRSADVYRTALERHVIPELGRLRLREVTTTRLDRFIHQLRKQSGYSVAKLCRTVLSGICGFAVRQGALRSNPVRDVGRLERDRVKAARALTLTECGEWLALLDADADARRQDLPDLVRFMLGTGVRIGEALGVTWVDVDLDRQVVHIRRTVLRVRGQGLVAKAPKTRAGERSLRLPLWLVGVLRLREPGCEQAAPLFPDNLGGYRDPNNVERMFRTARTGTKFDWVVPHTYRKTVATLLDSSQLSARVVADQLGHARISMTQDVYMGRRVVDSSAASALDALLGASKDETVPDVVKL